MARVKVKGRRSRSQGNVKFVEGASSALYSEVVFKLRGQRTGPGYEGAEVESDINV